MKKHFGIVTLALSTSLIAASADAAFQYTVTRTNNALATGGKSYDRITFKVLNDGLSGVDRNGIAYATTGTKVLAMENNIVSSKPMRFYAVDTNGDGASDINLTGAPGTITSTQFTKYNPTLYQFPIVNSSVPLPSPVSTASYDAVSAFASTLTLTQYTGAALVSPPVANVSAYSFLTVIVESGATVRTFGLVGGDAGGAVGGIIGPESGPEATVNFALDITSAVPEPTSLSLLAVTGLVARRRR